MVFNLSDKKSYDDVYLENIINYFEQLQNARGYVTRCYMLLAVLIYLIRRNKLHKALRFYDESPKYELPSGYLPGAFFSSQDSAGDQIKQGENKAWFTVRIT